MKLELNEHHEYTLDGRSVPGVTEVIRQFVPAWQCGQWYLDRGAAVHLAITLALKGRLDWNILDSRIKGRVDAIMQTLLNTQCDHVITERALGSKRYRFAGTLDYVGHLHGTGLLLMDWKGSLSPEAELQLGAYSLLWRENDGREISKAAAAECHDDASFKIRWLDKRELRDAGQTFLQMLTVYGWLKKHNKLKATKND